MAVVWPMDAHGLVIGEDTYTAGDGFRHRERKLRAEDLGGEGCVSCVSGKRSPTQLLGDAPTASSRLADRAPRARSRPRRRAACAASRPGSPRVKTAPALELGRRGGPHRCGGAHLHAFHLMRRGGAFASSDVLACRWRPGSVTIAPRMQPVGVHPALPQATLERDREEHVRRLRLAVSPPLVVRAPLEVDVVEDDRRKRWPRELTETIARRRPRRNAGASRADEQEVAQVVGGELRLVALGSVRPNGQAITPALLTARSTCRGCARKAFAKARTLRGASSESSITSRRSLPVESRISDATCPAFARSRAPSVRLAPRSASALAVSAPRPPEAPVTSACFPERSSRPPPRMRSSSCRMRGWPRVPLFTTGARSSLTWPLPTASG